MTADRLAIRLFGHPNVTFAGEPLKFAKRSTTLAMLALVVLQRGQSISRDALAFTLFPEEDEAAALAELRRYLYLANKSLPERNSDPWLVVDSETVRWNTDAGADIDIIDFERLAANAETQAHAVELYTGDLLEDVYDDWVVAERERLRTRYLTVLTELLDRSRGLREYPAAIAYAKRILSADPWREDTLRSLLAVRYESGDTAGALAEFERFAKRLRDELAIAPMPETLAVRASILRNEAVPGSLEISRGADARASRSSIPILPFVGRRKELSMLHAAWSRAARGNGTLLVVRGEAGIGKTRLTGELARTVQSEGGRVFAGTTASPESSPYQSIVEALRSGLPLLLARPPDKARRAALAGLLPELRDQNAPNVALPEQSAERASARLYDALAHGIRALSSPRPLLLVLEDLQWAGSATMDALGTIVRELFRSPVLIVVTARAEETPVDHPLRALVRSLRSFQNVEELLLEPLGKDEVDELVARVDGLRARGDAIARDLYAHSEGNALFLNEAISGVLESEAFPTPIQGVLGVENGPLPANPGPLGVSKGTISSVFGSRIALLSEEARSVAEIAAVAGAGCSVSLVSEVSNMAPAAVGRGFDDLLDRRILREAGSRASHDYVFTHHLIAKAMYDDIEPAFRAQRHGRIARVLEREHRTGEPYAPREIARHYELAADDERASEWYVTASRAAAGVYAYADAIDLATRSLERSPSPALQRAALELREVGFGRRGERDAQRADIETLERLAGADPRSCFDVLERRILFARITGESAEEGRLIDDLNRVAEALDDTARAQALAHRATYAGLLSKHGDGIPPALAALALYERSGDVRGQLECLYLLVEYAANTGDLAGSRSYLSSMHGRAADLGDRNVEARALAVASIAALLRHDYRDSTELSAQALALQIATGDREGEAASRGRLAACAAWLSDYSTAFREYDLTLETYASIGHKRGLALTYTNRAMLLMRVGLFADALASIERSTTLFETVHERRTIAANLVNASFVRLQLGDAVEAKSLAEESLTIAREIGFPIFEAAALANIGNAERALGKHDAAIEHMEAGLAMRRAIQEPRDFVDDLADLALAYAGADRRPEALATARELFALGESSFDAAFWPHYAWWAMGRGFLAGGESAKARTATKRAREELRAFADKIEDERAHAAFMSVPVNLAIAAAK